MVVPATRATERPMPRRRPQPAAPQIATGMDQLGYQQPDFQHLNLPAGKNRRANVFDQEQQADVQRYQKKLQQQQGGQQVDESKSMGVHDTAGYSNNGGQTSRPRRRTRRCPALAWE